MSREVKLPEKVQRELENRGVLHSPLEKYVKELWQEVLTLREALGFCADGTNLRIYDEGVREYTPEGYTYFGEKARQTLNESIERWGE